MKTIAGTRRWLLAMMLAVPLSVPLAVPLGVGSAAAAAPLGVGSAAAAAPIGAGRAAAAAPIGAPTSPAGSAAANTDDCPTSSLATGITPVSDAAAAGTPFKVWMAGDSTMQNASACPIGWGSQFDPLFNTDVTVVNSAIGGRSIQTWLYDPNVTTTKDAAGECVVSPQTYSARWQAMLDPSTGMKGGDYLFIQFGINDGTSACPRHVGTARYQQLLTMMADAARQRGARPIFLTPVAAITCSGSTAIGNRGFVNETFAAGAANQVPVIDLHRLSYTLYNTLRLCPNNGDYTSGAVGAFFCNDHTHFEAAGAQQIARLVAQALRDQGIPLAASLR